MVDEEAQQTRLDINKTGAKIVGISKIAGRPGQTCMNFRTPSHHIPYLNYLEFTKKNNKRLKYEMIENKTPKTTSDLIRWISELGQQMS
jgi:hypothetical protein